MSKKVTARGAEFRFEAQLDFIHLEARIHQEILALPIEQSVKQEILARFEKDLGRVSQQVYQKFEDIWEDIRKERPLSNAGTAKAIQDTKADINHEVNRMLGQCPLNRDYYEPMREDVRHITDGHMETLKAKLGVRDV